MEKELDPATPVAATEATPVVATTNECSNSFAASVSFSGSPLKAALVLSGVSMIGFAVVKLVNKHCREKKVEVVEK